VVGRRQTDHADDVRIPECFRDPTPRNGGDRSVLGVCWGTLSRPRARSYGQGMSDNTMTGQRWVAFGPAGAIGSIHRTDGGFLVKLLDAPEGREYPTLEVAKSALHASLPSGADWPEFREH